MQKTLYLHIGPHKTGTTSIQRALFMNDESLRKQGVLCPRSGRVNKKTAAQHNLSWIFRQPIYPRFDPKFGLWEDLIAEIKSEPEMHTIVLSSEGFDFLTQAQVFEVGNILRDYEVKIVMYLRRQDVALQSTWVTLVRNLHGPEKVDSFLKWLVDSQYISWNTDYLGLIQRWAAVFGEQNMVLQVFNPKAFSDGLFSNFLSLCDIQLEKITLPNPWNPSPGVKTIEAIRFLKNNLSSDDISLDIWHRMVNLVNAYGDHHHWNENKVNYLNKSLSSKIMEQHEKANREIARKYLHREQLFEVDSLEEKNHTTFTYEDFQKDELIGLFLSLVRGFSKQISI